MRIQLAYQGTGEPTAPDRLEAFWVGAVLLAWAVLEAILVGAAL